MNSVVATSGTASPKKLSNLNIKKPILAKCANYHRINQNSKHIKFEELVKCYYYDLDHPIVKPRPYFLSQLNLNKTTNTLYNQNAAAYCHLESLKLTKYPNESDLIQLEGHVIVMNLCYKKRVTVRYTLNEWKTFSDTDAFFVNSIDPKRDRFMFTLRVNKSLLECVTESFGLSMAIRYEFREIVYWDNNSGANYQFLLHY